MAKITKLSEKEFKDIASKHKFNEELLAKDYYVTCILCLVKDIQGIYFKGGTALQKIFLNYSRLSEDADFTITRNSKEVVSEIIKILEESKLFSEITRDKDVEGFTRLVVHYKGFPKDGTIFIDLNQRSKLLLKPETHKISHFYKENIPDFSVNTLAKEEMAAEKVAAAIGRNMPRDHYDIYKIIKAEMPINMDLVERKCISSKTDFDIIKMFNKAQKLKTRWDNDLLPLLAEEVSFKEVMTSLAEYFKLKDKKRKKKQII